MLLQSPPGIAGFSHHSGDGINDASALHAAGVGISVNSAVDVASVVLSMLAADLAKQAFHSRVED